MCKKFCIIINPLIPQNINTTSQVGAYQLLAQKLWYFLIYYRLGENVGQLILQDQFWMGRFRATMAENSECSVFPLKVEQSTTSRGTK